MMFDLESGLVILFTISIQLVVLAVIVFVGVVKATSKGGLGLYPFVGSFWNNNNNRSTICDIIVVHDLGFIVFEKCTTRLYLPRVLY